MKTRGKKIVREATALGRVSEINRVCARGEAGSAKATETEGTRRVVPLRATPAQPACPLTRRVRRPGLFQKHALALLLAFLAAGWLLRDSSPQATGVTYGTSPNPSLNLTHDWSFAIHPLHNPAKLARTYQPLLDTLRLPAPTDRLLAEPSRDYAAYEEKIAAQLPDFLLPNPWHALQAMEQGYRVIAMAGRREDFRGLIITRRDRGLRDLAQLRGQVVAYPSPTALAACIMPQWMMHEHGLDVLHDLRNRFVGSQHSAIMHAYLGEAAAGVTWPPPWLSFQAEYPLEAAELEVAWETPPLINNAVMAHRRVPDNLAKRVAEDLCALSETEPGRRLLADVNTNGFYPATDADYEPARAFVARFEAEVRPVKDGKAAP
jgi:phosphonate transport system substrate-binding protein